MVACGGSSPPSHIERFAQELPDLDQLPIEIASAVRTGARLDPHATRPPAGHDPLALARASIGTTPSHDLPTAPPSCYATSDGVANTCASCHTRSAYPNLADDWELQQNYSFPEDHQANPWKNLFRDRHGAVGWLDDAAILAYIRVDNYAPLRAEIAGATGFRGWRPDVDLAAGFDADGFARDGSGWRAVRYKPFPGAWATNGRSDDLYVKLPEAMRRDGAGQLSRGVERANFAILEAAITADAAAVDASVRDVEPIDERAAGLDLDRDGQLATATRVVGLPATYAGGGAGEAVKAQLYPVGVELMHSLRYLDPDAPGGSALRMKELRYARKDATVEGRARAMVYADAEYGEGPRFTGDPLIGVSNGFGWRLQGWIEDEGGWLRLQTEEEHQFCMGCHSGLGVTVDHTFSFARKVPGAAGWRVQDPRGIADVPEVGHDEAEYAGFLARVGGGDELRDNPEIIAAFLPDGALDAKRAAALRGDITTLVLPSRDRALALNRAYLTNVLEQSYVWGRDAVDAPAQHVRARIAERSTGIGEAQLTRKDTRLLLDWSRESSDRSR